MTAPTAINGYAAAACLLALGLLVGSALIPSGARAGPAHALSWHEILPSSHPAARDRAGLAYDPSDNYTVMYGGYDAYGAPFYFDTWEYQGGAWMQLHPSQHPSAPTGFVTAYDPSLSGVLAFGGEAPYGSSYYNDTWLFHSGNWTQLSPSASPPGRSQYAMAYDAADSEMVLFGGIDGTTSELSDTWAFNGTTWTQVNGGGHPQGRQSGSMVYDANAQQVLLFGGKNSSLGAVSGTWAFSGGHWSKVRYAGTPLQSYMITATMGNGTPILFGGLATGGTPIYNSSFEFFSGAWHRIHFVGAPPPRGIASMTYDAYDGYLVTFGGWNAKGGYHVLSGTWALS